VTDPHGPANPERRDRKAQGIALLPAGTNGATYDRFIAKIPHGETRSKLEEMLRVGDFAGVQEALKRYLIPLIRDSTGP